MRLYTRALLPVVFVISCFSLALGQAPGKSGCKIESSYDRDADLTTTLCTFIKLPEFEINIIAEYPGKTPPKTPKFSFKFFSLDKKRTRPLFEKAETFFITADSDRMQLPIKNYRYLQMIGFETAEAEIEVNSLLNIAKASKVEGRWGPTKFVFPDKSVKALSYFVSQFQNANSIAKAKRK